MLIVLDLQPYVYETTQQCVCFFECFLSTFTVISETVSVVNITVVHCPVKYCNALRLPCV
jgi:hypothetical protein